MDREELAERIEWLIDNSNCSEEEKKQLREELNKD